MPLKLARSYELTPSLYAAHASGQVVCLAAGAVGRRYRLHARRPGASMLRRPYRIGSNIAWRLDAPASGNRTIAPPEEAPAGLVRVDIAGPLEQRAGLYDECGGWSDGHDAVAERLCAALAEGDVLLVGDTPGGACAGLQQGVALALKAKAQYGRKVIGWADEMIGSAGVWWSHALCDEMFVPAAGQVGSIGARAGHLDVSKAMEMAGEKMTYFADPPEKVALAPEYPLSKVGAERGNRDVKLAADAFRAAVCAGPIGVRRGLTPEGLLALGADMLTGQAAVDAGLADGVATFEEVVAYALAQAGREEAAVRT